MAPRPTDRGRDAHRAVLSVRQRTLSDLKINHVCEPSRSYGMVWTMSIAAASPTPHLTATSYLVLGLIEREGPSTPYELKRHVAATIGHFWSFPHALLYTEPPRLVKLGLLTEEREADGRRRRLFTITERAARRSRHGLRRPRGNRPSCAMPACSSCSSRIWGQPTTARPLLVPSWRSIALRSAATRTTAWPSEGSTVRIPRRARSSIGEE